MSDAQMEQVIGMLADLRVKQLELSHDIQEDHAERKASQKILSESLHAIEQDLGKVQASLRDVLRSLGSHEQALDGLTQLAKTNFDLTESLQKYVHGEESRPYVSAAPEQAT
jgi:chromosome segregation ATPase